MALKLRDGYTLPFITKAELCTSDGTVLYANLTPIRGKYRPPLFGVKNDFEFALMRCRSGEDESALIAGFIAARVAEWDIEYKGGTAPITADFIEDHLPNEYTLAILKEVREWAGEDEAAGNSDAVSGRG